MNKNIFCIFMVITVFIFNNISVNANYVDYADSPEMQPYKQEAENVKIKYIFDNEYIDIDGNHKNGIFKLEITGITENLRLVIFDTDIVLTEKDEIDGVITITGIESGVKKIGIYYNKTYIVLLKTINLSIPKYNIYSEREECIGISIEDVEMCDAWYPYEINESTFLYKISEYNKNQEKNEIIEDNETVMITTFNKIVNWLSKYYIYIISIIVLIILIVGFVVFRKKRYSLE